MKTRAFAILAFAVSGSLALAAVPKKVPVTNYSKLWSQSPFTTKPPPKTNAEENSALDDWTLGGVSEVTGGGYMITLLNKKNVGESQIIRPGGVQKMLPDKVEWLELGAPGTFKLDRVEYGKGGWKDISVHLLAGGRPGVIKFDDKTTVPKAGAAPQVNRQGQPGQPGQQPPGQQPQPGQQPVPQQPAVQQQPGQNNNNGGQRRQRVLPPAPQPTR